MYAIVRSGGKQHKVAEGDIFQTEKVDGLVGSSVSLPALLLVDGADVTSGVDQLKGVAVTAEVVSHTKGPTIMILKYKNKTGYKKRQGHRQRLTMLRITGISRGES